MKLFAGFLAFGLTASAVRVVNFDNAPLGKTPPGWTVPMANHGWAPVWEVRSDRSAPTQPYVLARVAGGAPGDHCPLAIWDGASLRDGEISVRIKPVSGREMQTGGIVWRYRDENNYYLARASALERNVQVFKVENGRRMPLLAAVRHDIPSNQWSILKVAVKGNRFQVYVDHRRVLQVQDGTFAAPGKVGLWTVGDSVTYFDDFRVAAK
ncbi:MAG: hypothetical protein KGN36_18650 [Acidobacteriota bacterium]|nr:hypothetical protein [Acidobacteriota bacterium]